MVFIKWDLILEGPIFFDPDIVIFAQRILVMEIKKIFSQGWMRIFKNKYFVASVLFLVWIFFFDENNFVSHQENKQRLKQFVQQREYYKKKIASDKQKLEDLKEGEEKLEKFARENYYMSKSDEDVFIVVEED